jgi:hypothetical protein
MFIFLRDHIGFALNPRPECFQWRIRSNMRAPNPKVLTLMFESLYVYNTHTYNTCIFYMCTYASYLLRMHKYERTYMLDGIAAINFNRTKSNKQRKFKAFNCLITALYHANLKQKSNPWIQPRSCLYAAKCTTYLIRGQKQKHTTGGIPRWSPTLVLVARFSAYVWQSGRDAQFPLTYGRMYHDIFVQYILSSSAIASLQTGLALHYQMSNCPYLN